MFPVNCLELKNILKKNVYINLFIKNVNLYIFHFETNKIYKLNISIMVVSIKIVLIQGRVLSIFHTKFRLNAL